MTLTERFSDLLASFKKPEIDIWDGPSIHLRETTALVRNGVTTDGVGIETAGRHFTQVIPAGCSVPLVWSETFTTTHDDQDHITIAFYQGHEPDVDNDTPLGTIQIRGIASAPAGTPEVLVKLALDSYGHLLVAAADSRGQLEVVRVDNDGA
jgi:endoplasmic reticulum chaperone BiP